MNVKTIPIAIVISAVSALLFVASSGPALAQVIKHDQQGDTSFPDLDIHLYGIAGKRAFIQVWGTAGGTIADHEHGAIAYVLEVVTTTGEHQTWAIDSHERQHGDSGEGESWHAHRVVVEGNCLNEVDQVNPATVHDKHVWFENMVIRGKSGNLETVDVAEVLGAATVELELQVEDPDNPPEGTECIALVTHVFDTA
jgi:hypothetical protein